MKEAFADLKQLFPVMPHDCEQALMNTVYSVREKQPVATFFSLRRTLILTAALLTVAVMASAAFYPQIISWFESRYGSKYAQWMENGSVAVSDAVKEAEGAVFTVNEVLVKDRGLYVMGTIQAADGYTLVEYDCSAQEPFGYNVHHGENAPEGTPTIAEKATETGSKLRYVICHIEKIGVDGGVMLMPASWGYDAKVQRDGSIVFTMEIEDGTAIEPGTTYTLEFSAQTYGANSDGTLNTDDVSQAVWQFDVVPLPISQP